MQSHQIILITFTGNYSAASTGLICELISQHQAEILDMGQAVIHNSFNLSLLIKVGSDIEIAMLLKDLVIGTADLDLKVRFTVVREDSQFINANTAANEKYILTLLAKKLTTSHLNPVIKALETHGLNIIRINRLSSAPELTEAAALATTCIQFILEGNPCNLNALKASFLDISHQMGLDIAFQKDTPFRRNRRLVCFDMDSTLIEGEVIDELAHEAGVGEAVAKITAQAMRGEIDFDQSFRARVALLTGLSEACLTRVAERLTLTEGAQSLIKILQALGYKTAILSGGFSYFGKRLQQKLGIDYMYANNLEIIDGKVSGKVSTNIINGAKKAELLTSLAAKEGINLQQVIAVGDGANDLPMLNIAGLGIAYRAKALVKANAEQSLSHLGLDGICYLMGITDDETRKLLAGNY